MLYLAKRSLQLMQCCKANVAEIQHYPI